MLIALAVIWAISPFVLIPLMIAYIVKSSNLEKENRRLKEQMCNLINKSDTENTNTVTPPFVQPENNAVSSRCFTYSPDNTVQQAVPNVQNVPEQKPIPAPTVQADYIAQPIKQKGVSAINIVLIIGALLVILSGIIFASTTWEALPDILRAITLFSFSAVFFGISSLAKRKLSLPKTGTVFFTLASFFLPITIIAAGFLGLFGEWFSLFGEGRFLLMSVTFLTFSGLALKGSANYNNRAFAWGSLVSFSAGTVLFLRQLIGGDIFILLIAIWGFAVVIVSEKLSQYESEQFPVILSQLKAFSIGNTLLLALLTIFASGNTAVSFAACMIFACGFMRSSFTDINGYAGAVPFMTLMVTALYKLMEPNAVDGYVFIAAAAAAVMTVLSLMNLFGDKVKRAFNLVSVISSGLILTIAGLTIIFGDKPTPLMLASFAILTANTVWLGFKNNKNKAVFSAASCEFIILGTGLVKIFIDDTFFCSAAVFVFAALLLLIYIFIKIPFRNTFSDFLFPLTMGLSVLAMLISGSKNDAPVTAVCIAVNIIEMFLLYKNTNKFRAFWRYGLIFTSSLICFPYSQIANLIYGTVEVETAFIHIFRVFTCLIIFIGGIMYALSVKKEKYKVWNLPFVVSIVFFSIAALLCSIGEGPGYPITIAVTLYCALRAFVSENEKKASFVLFIIGSIISVPFAVQYYYHTEKPYIYFLFAAAPAVIGYAVYELLSAEINEFRYRRELYRTSSLSMCIISFAISASLFDMMNYDYSNTVFTTSVVLTLILIAVACFSCYRTKKTIPALIPLIMGLYLIIMRAELTSLGKNTNLFMSCILVLMALILLIGRILHRQLITKANEGKGLYLDIFSLSDIILLPIFFTYGNENWQWGVQLITAALISAVFSGRIKSKNAEKIFWTVSAALFVTSWWSQPFFKLPSVISLELNLAPLFLFCLALRFIWRGKEKAIETITFVLAVITTFILFVDANISQLLADALIIVVASLVMLIASFILKRKKWFLLAVLTLVVTTIFMTESFWMSLAWWIYLLAAGILLIAIGAMNEMKKQNVGKNIGKKLTRFMSDWTW
jgi:hypothetical protein